MKQRLYDRYRDQQDDLVRDAISLFKSIRRDFQPNREPSMAELLNWLDYLLRQVKTPRKRLTELEPALLSLSVRCLLLKQKEDQERADEVIKEWKKNKGTEG